VHTYRLCPKERTLYLSELKSGDEVVVCSRGAGCGLDAKTEVVGRCKVQRRSLVLNSADTREDQAVSRFPQNVDTCRVCIVSPDGVLRVCRVVGLQPGNRILLRPDENARHLG
jgi:3-dehydroquinate synthase II